MLAIFAQKLNFRTKMCLGFTLLYQFSKYGKHNCHQKLPNCVHIRLIQNNTIDEEHEQLNPQEVIAKPVTILTTKIPNKHY